MQFTNKEVDNLERNLMRGMYIRRLKDFADIQREQTENVSILERLLQGMKMDDNDKPIEVYTETNEVKRPQPTE